MGWGRQYSMSPVTDTDDLKRIVELPRRAVLSSTDADSDRLIDHVTNYFSRGAVTCQCAQIDPKRKCITRLRLTQAWGLYEIADQAGLFGPINVGDGKCHAAGTEFFDYSTGRRRDVSESGYCSVAAYDQPSLAVFSAKAFPSGKKRCVKVVLQDGLCAVPSSDHPYLTARGWVPAEDLVAGQDFVAVARNIPEPTNPTLADDDEVALVAYMLADGSCSQRAMAFTNCTPSVIADWKRCAETVCTGWSFVDKKSRATTFRLLGSGSSQQSGWGPQTGFRKKWGLYGLAKEKRTHPALWGLPRKQIALFVNRFWACDGHVSNRSVEVTLASEKLIDDLRFMLLRLGVRARKKYSPKTLNGHVFDAWRLYAYGSNALAFLRAVGDVIGKEAQCKRLLSKLENSRRNTNTDVVPVGPAEVHQICDELGLQGRGGDVRSRRTSGRTAITRFLRSTQGQYVSRGRFIEFCHKWQYTGKYSHLASTDVAWERVESVVDAGVREVFDLSVPGPRNFVANGMVVHNTLMGILAPLAMPDCKVALLLCPAKLVDQTVLEYRMVSQHFRVPSLVVHGKGQTFRGEFTTLHVMSYERLSNPNSTTFLENLRADTFIMDECDWLKLKDDNTPTTRTGRVLSHYKNHPNTRAIAWSGSVTDRRIDYPHIAAMTLREGSPVPLRLAVVDEWNGAIGPSDNPSPPGALLKLCRPGEDVRSGFHRRLTETPGVVTSTTQQVDADLSIEPRASPPMPRVIVDALHRLRTEWVRPDDADIADPLEFYRVAHQLACGFYYRWIFTHGETVAEIEEWLKARKLWYSEMRGMVQQRPHLDSPALIARAADRGAANGVPVGRITYMLIDGVELPCWGSEHRARWSRAKPLVNRGKKPETEPVRLHPYLAEDAAAWARDHRGIVWYLKRAFGEWVAEIGGLPLHGGGADAGPRIGREDGSRSIVASIKSHGRGRDGLQYVFDQQLVGHPPSSSRDWEQLLGRLHRSGQPSPVVRTWYYTHTEELEKSVNQALRRARYVQTTIGNVQKLNLGGTRGSGE